MYEFALSVKALASALRSWFTWKERCQHPRICLTGLFSSLPLLWSQATAQLLPMELTIDINEQANHNVVYQQTKSLAWQTIEAAFAQDATVSAVEVIVSAERNGQILPLFAVTAPRTGWQEQPNIEVWITWIAPSFSTGSLLGFSTTSLEQTSTQLPLLVVEPFDLPAVESFLEGK